MERGHRNHGIKIRVRTPSGLLVGELDGVDGGTIDFSAAASVKGSGSMTVRDVGQTVDWVSDLFQPVYIVDGIEYPLGVFVASVPTDDWDDEGRVWDVELMDRTSILDRSALETSLSIPAGANVVDSVTAVIGMAGIDPGAITPSTHTLRGNLVWEAGTTLLKVVNELLDSVNFFSLYCDGDGRFQVAPYVEPSRRAVRVNFVDGANCTYTPKWKGEQDIYSIPNRVIAVTASSADEPALTAVARNENPESPFSFQGRGRWVDEVIADVEAADQATLNAYVARRLVELSSATATREITHLFEDLAVNDAVRFTHSPAGVDARHVVTNISVPLNEVGLVKTTLREVAEV